MKVPALPPGPAFALLNKRLRGIEKDTEKALTREIRRVVTEVRDEVRSSTKPPHRRGKIRKSVKTSVRRKHEAALVSKHPAAPVWNFGGVIEPRGVPITIPKTNFVSGPVAERGPETEQNITDAFGDIAREHGFLGT